MPECELDYGLVWRADGGTYDWQMADRSRAEHNTVIQRTSVLAGTGTSRPVEGVDRPGGAIRSALTPKLNLNNVYRFTFLRQE